MHYWLLKSEPDVFSFQDLVAKGSSMWDGVRNYQARNNLKAMKVGDQALFYHSNIGKEVVGVCKITKEYYPDPTADKGEWVVVEVEPLHALRTPVSLARIKDTPALSKMPLVKHTRLSVMPVAKQDFELILKLGS